jgi:branched-chain amino acid transport system substrate-binding protein
VRDAGAGRHQSEIRMDRPARQPLSGFGMIGRVQEAYFEKINAEGGINGRKIRFISMDDAYSPPKTVEHTQACEQDEVQVMFASLNTATNNAVHRYLNGKILSCSC